MTRCSWTRSATPLDRDPSAVVTPDYGTARCGVAVANTTDRFRDDSRAAAHLPSGWLDGQRVRADRPGE
jgi:hypothetical protein